MLRPGVVALLFIAAIAITLGIQPLLERGVLEEAYSQVFVIVCEGTPEYREMSASSYGTGWWVNDSGYAVTAYHVVDTCDTITGVRGAWSSQLQLIAYNPELDVALLKAVNPPDWAEGLPLGYSASIGDKVYIVGYPLQVVAELDGDLARASTAPRVAEASIAWISPDRAVMELEGETDKGNSGGPVVSLESGGVVGIIVYAREGAVSTSIYALRMDALAPFLDSYNVEYEVAGRPPLLLLGLGLLGALGLALVLSRGVRLGA
ncbi:hypothetical protein [Aeropyrum globular virus 1]|uniref:protease n=1 Tax=Aeropyrum globular virus 1 TaxID=1932713 RepID=UPI000C7F6D78|nr:protease [Aeropyrum globular virus 1]BBC20930.1 hypothetical protein [Aeropyrum globular virus 1]